MTHELKTWMPFFEEIMLHDKKFEARKNDRGFKKGDYLILMEYNQIEDVYTGRKIKVFVTSILHGPCAFGIEKDYCIMSIRPTL